MAKKHKFFATTATAALVASAIIPVASASELNDFDSIPTWAQEAVQSLVDLGAVQGDENGNFKPSSNLTRAQAAEILYKALDLKAEGTENFSDVSANNWFYNAVLATSPELFEGDGTGKFNPNTNLTRQEAAKVLVEAFELTGSTNLNFPDASKASNWAVSYLETAVENGVITGKGSLLAPADKITKAEFATMVKRADDAAKENATPEVISVNAIDAKTIEVKFNNAVDAETLVDASSNDVITVVAGAGASVAGAITQELSVDGKTLTLTATNIFKGDYTVKVPFEIIKDVNGNFVSPVNAKVNVNDKTAPVLTGATSKIKDTQDGLKEITLEFNEYVASIDTVKINGVNYSAVVNGKKATVAVDLDATKTYNVTVVNATDAAGNVKDVQEAALNVTVDNIAPSIVSVVPAGENKVTVTLDEELKNDTLTITGKIGTFTSDVVEKAEVNANNKKQYTVTLKSTYLFKNGNSDTVTLTVAKDALSDALGNTNASEVTKNVVVSKDATAPSVVNVETAATDGKVTSFSVTYNEEIINPTLTGVKVVNSKGEILSASAVVSKVEVSAKDAKTVVFTLPSDLATDKYSFELPEGFVVDTALTANKSAKYAFNVDVTEAGKPVETSFDIVDATAVNNVITVDFGAKVKATGTGSALNAAAYQVNGVALPSDTKIEFATAQDASTDQTKVVITLPTGFVKADDAQAIFRVNAVQTLDNKVSNQFTKLIAVADNTAPEVKTIVATDLTTLTVTYTEAIKLTDGAVAADIQDEIKLVDSKGAAVAFTGAQVVDGKLVLTVADATTVSSLSTVEVDALEQNIFDLNDVAQKAGLTVTK